MKTKLSILVSVLLISACAAQSVIIQTSAEMIAEELGVAVAKNNMDNGFRERVEGYYEDMQALYASGSQAALTNGLRIGVQYLLDTYTGDDLTSKRIASKVMRLLKLSGLPEKLEMPQDSALMEMAPEYIMGIVEAFVSGVRMV